MKTDLMTALVNKAEQVSKAADFLMQKTRDWQTVKAYMCGKLEIDLTEEQQLKMGRYNFIYGQLVSGKYTDLEVINQLKVNYKIGLTQAYEDLSSTREIFTVVAGINRRFEVMLQLQINRKMLNKANEIGDLKAYAQLEKNRALLAKLLPEEDENPAEMFEGHEIEATFDPSLLGAPAIDMEEMKKVMESINAKRNKKIRVDLFEPITHEDVTDENTTAL